MTHAHTLRGIHRTSPTTHSINPSPSTSLACTQVAEVEFTLTTLGIKTRGLPATFLNQYTCDSTREEHQGRHQQTDAGFSAIVEGDKRMHQHVCEHTYAHTKPHKVLQAQATCTETHKPAHTQHMDTMAHMHTCTHAYTDHTDALVKLVAITSSRPSLSMSATVTKLGEGTDSEMALLMKVPLTFLCHEICWKETD